jgi:ABC-type uncharacterized transport system permease subunit
MNILLAATIALSLYLVCTVLLMLRIKQVTAVASFSLHSLLIPGFLGLAAHLVVLYSSMVSPIGINLGFYNSLSLVGAFITLFTLVSALRHPVEMLAILMMPIASLVIALDLSNTSTHMLPPGSSSGLLLHVLSSLIAYSILGLAALHAIVLSIQNSYLHSHQPGGIIRLLPPLKTMESLLFETIIIGFVCLSVSLASGLLFLENMFVQQLAHKTVLSIIAWFVFAILLFGHWSLGWRGRTATRWTLVGFASLMLAYFGSKFVLEVILTPA